jgi:GNAT superfamily N-acetyltransferase
MPINSRYRSDRFDCGDPATNASLRQFAGDPGISGSSPVFAAVDEQNIISGFYSLTASNIEFAELPNNPTEKINTYPVPTVIINHIAVHKTLQGKGIGARLLIDALQRIYNAGDEVEVMAVLVEAKNERLRAFYLHYGFIPLSGSGSRLFLPMDKIIQLFEEQAE